MAAVQARDLSLDLPDLRNRPFKVLDLENVFVNADKYTPRAVNYIPDKMNHHQMPQPVAGPTMMISNADKWLAAQYACAIGDVNDSAQKKRRDSSNLQLAEKRPRMYQVSGFFNEVHNSSAHVGLSLGQISACGLRPRAEDDGSIVTSSRPNLTMPITLDGRLSAQITKQQNEISDLLQTQTEQLRLAIEERTQQHSKNFLAALGEELSRTLRSRDMELEQMSQTNLELQQKVNHLSLETQAWQSKAWSYDAMVSALRANLQQVLMQQMKRQTTAEGYGDSEMDASSAVHIDEAVQLTRAPMTGLQRACKKCKSNEVSILLLPCLHLCLCKDCRHDIGRCPSCNLQICDRVEVYLS